MMSELTPRERYEWLDAGRALGDLTPEEESEWKHLSDELGRAGGEEVPFDSIVATLEQEFSAAVELPSELSDRLRKDAKLFKRAEGKGDEPSPTAVVLESSFWKNPAFAWAAAACLALLLVFESSRSPDSGGLMTGAEIADQLKRGPQVLRLTFSRTEENGGTAGEVLWSDAEQRGVMLLTGLPANRSSESQYQLWIVDATRDDTHPVDGGVFDIPAGVDGVVAIPIDAKLRVKNPGAFVITLEQPGGVVVSKQEQVIAVAKA